MSGLDGDTKIETTVADLAYLVLKARTHGYIRAVIEEVEDEEGENLDEPEFDSEEETNGYLGIWMGELQEMLVTRPDGTNYLDVELDVEKDRKCTPTPP